jgi:hypothetical protein
MGEHSTIPSLVAYLVRIPEYRQARGKHRPLLALLLPICVGLLFGAQGQSAIADRGRFCGPVCCDGRASPRPAGRASRR